MAVVGQQERVRQRTGPDGRERSNGQESQLADCLERRQVLNDRFHHLCGTVGPRVGTEECRPGKECGEGDQIARLGPVERGYVVFLVAQDDAPISDNKDSRKTKNGGERSDDARQCLRGRLQRQLLD